MWTFPKFAILGVALPSVNGLLVRDSQHTTRTKGGVEREYDVYADRDRPNPCSGEYGPIEVLRHLNVLCSTNITVNGQSMSVILFVVLW
jgi:hypothetical protein